MSRDRLRTAFYSRYQRLTPSRDAVRTLATALLFLMARTATAQVPLPEPGQAFGSGGGVIGHDVVVSVSPIYELAVSASDVTLTIGGAEAGGSLIAAESAGTTYAVTTNGTGQKITGALSAPFADGVDLEVALGAPGGAASTPRTLGTTAQDLVTGLTRLVADGLAVTYTATADVTVPPNAATGGETRTITFTITDG